MKCRIWQLLNLFLVVFAFYEAFTFELSAQNQVDQLLTNDWKLTNSKTGELFPCRIPSEVHTTLFENQVIEDPFFGKNETDLQWIGDQQWDYSCTFLPDESLLQCGQIELQFGGLDTYCSIYLNDSLLLQTNNAFRSWRIPVKYLIKNEINKLIIKFIPIANLQQNAAREVILGLGVFNPKLDIFEHKFFYVRQCDVGAGLGIVQTAVRILLDQTRLCCHDAPRQKS